MGDTGSLALGGMIGTVAVATKHEMSWRSSAVSSSWKRSPSSSRSSGSSGRENAFSLMAPIHHHFEKLGWTESQVVIRFWIIAVGLAMVGLATLKLR